METNASAFEKLVRARSLQIIPHPSGQSNHEVFSAGQCHVLAVALQQRIGGELVLLTPAHDPDHLVHAAVLTKGIVADADGYRCSGTWHAIWDQLRDGEPMSARLTSRAELGRLMPHSPIDASSLAAAKDYADALAGGWNLPIAAWRGLLPFGCTTVGRVDDKAAARLAFEAALKQPVPSIAPFPFEARRTLISLPANLSRGPSDMKRADLLAAHSDRQNGRC